MAQVWYTNEEWLFVLILNRHIKSWTGLAGSELVDDCNKKNGVRRISEDGQDYSGGPEFGSGKKECGMAAHHRLGHVILSMPLPKIAVFHKSSRSSFSPSPPL